MFSGNPVPVQVQCREHKMVTHTVFIYMFLCMCVCLPLKHTSYRPLRRFVRLPEVRSILGCFLGTVSPWAVILCQHLSKATRYCGSVYYRFTERGNQKRKLPMLSFFFFFFRRQNIKLVRHFALLRFTWFKQLNNEIRLHKNKTE